VDFHLSHPGSWCGAVAASRLGITALTASAGITQNTGRAAERLLARKRFPLLSVVDGKTATRMLHFELNNGAVGGGARYLLVDFPSTTGLTGSSPHWWFLC